MPVDKLSYLEGQKQKLGKNPGFFREKTESPGLLFSPYAVLTLLQEYACFHSVIEGKKHNHQDPGTNLPYEGSFAKDLLKPHF